MLKKGDKGPRNQAIKNYLETSKTCGCYGEHKTSKTPLDLLITNPIPIQQNKTQNFTLHYILLLTYAYNCKGYTTRRRGGKKIKILFFFFFKKEKKVIIGFGSSNEFPSLLIFFSHHIFSSHHSMKTPREHLSLSLSLSLSQKRLSKEMITFSF